MKAAKSRASNRKQQINMLFCIFSKQVHPNTPSAIANVQVQGSQIDL
jgi:hypothetical protein